MIKRADELEPGDVITMWRRRGVIVHNGPVVSAPPDQMFDGAQAKNCVEPRIVFLGKTGRMSAWENTYFIRARGRKYKVTETLDLDTYSATPKPIE